MAYKILFFLTIVTSCVNTAKILCIFHMHSKSHHNAAVEIFKGLANKGHEVTVVSPFPLKKTPINYQDIDLPEMRKNKEGLICF